MNYIVLKCFVKNNMCCYKQKLHLNLVSLLWVYLDLEPLRLKPRQAVTQYIIQRCNPWSKKYKKALLNLFHKPLSISPSLIHAYKKKSTPIFTFHFEQLMTMPHLKDIWLNQPFFLSFLISPCYTLRVLFWVYHPPRLLWIQMLMHINEWGQLASCRWWSRSLLKCMVSDSTNHPPMKWFSGASVEYGCYGKLNGKPQQSMKPDFMILKQISQQMWKTIENTI